MKAVISSIFILLALNFANAQSRHVEKAQNHFNMSEYVEALSILEKKTEKLENNYLAVKLLANTYFKLRDFRNAELYFSSLIQMPEVKAEDFFTYGQVLMTRGKAELAIKNFEAYLNKGGNVFLGKMLIESAKRGLKQESVKDLFILDSLIAINTPYSEFGIQFYKNNFYITSNRKEHFYSPEESSWVGGEFYNILEQDTTYLFKSKPVKLQESKGKLNSFYHDGPISIDENSNKIAVSRINNKMKGSDFVNQMKLYIAEYKNEKWKSFSEFPYNSDDYSLGQAAFADSGKTIYFSSDMPGGYGGMDLYVSYLKEGVWTMPINLGAEVNSPLNEVFPFYFQKRLYFSSDGHSNFGGLDILQSEMKYGRWDKPQSLPLPINSTADDFAFVLWNSNSGFLATNREGVIGSDDIYYFQKKRDQKINLYALFEYQGLPQENIKATLLDSRDSIIEVAYSDENGEFVFENLPYNEDYMIQLEAEDEMIIEEGRFFITDESGSKQLILSSSDGKYNFRTLPIDELKETNRLLANDNTSLIDLENTLSGTVYKKLPGDVNQKIKVFALNDYGEILDSATTDLNGDFTFKTLPADDGYLIKLSEDDPELLVAIFNEEGRMVNNVKTEDGYYNINESIDASKNQFLAKNLGNTTLIAKLSKNNTAVANEWIEIYDKDNNFIIRLLTNEKGEFQYNALNFDDVYFVKIESSDDIELLEDYDISIVNEQGNSLYFLKKLSDGKYQLNTLPYDEWQKLDVITSKEPILEEFVFKGQVYRKLPGDFNNESVVYAIDDNGVIVDSAITNLDGVFNFTKLKVDQSYTFRVKGATDDVSLVELDDKEQVSKMANKNEEGDFDFNKLKSDEVELLSLNAEDTIKSIDDITLRGQVYNKLPGDYGAGIEVLVYNDQGELVGSTYTDENGKFSFDKLNADDSYFFQINKVVGDVQLITFGEDNQIINRKVNDEFTYTRLKGQGEGLELINADENLLLLFDEEHTALKDYRLHYKFDWYELESVELEKLNELVEQLKKTDYSIELVSYTDNRGSDKYNIELSRKRSQFVVNYMLKNGISKDRIYSDYKGEAFPIVDCETIDCNATQHRLNRRTEFKILLSN